jgi:hypothetical protein
MDEYCTDDDNASKVKGKRESKRQRDDDKYFSEDAHEEKSTTEQLYIQLLAKKRRVEKSEVRPLVYLDRRAPQSRGRWTVAATELLYNTIRETGAFNATEIMSFAPDLYCKHNITLSQLYTKKRTMLKNGLLAYRNEEGLEATTSNEVPSNNMTSTHKGYGKRTCDTSTDSPTELGVRIKGATSFIKSEEPSFPPKKKLRIKEPAFEDLRMELKDVLPRTEGIYDALSKTTTGKQFLNVCESKQSTTDSDSCDDA